MGKKECEIEEEKGNGSGGVEVKGEDCTKASESIGSVVGGLDRG